MKLKERCCFIEIGMICLSVTLWDWAFFSELLPE